MPEPIPDGALVVLTRFTIRPEHVPDVGDLLRELADRTRTEPGCARYDVVQSRSDAVDFAVVGEWRSEDAYDAHIAAAHTVTFTHRLLAWLESGPEIRRYRPI